MTRIAVRSPVVALAAMLCLASAPASAAERIESRYFPNPELQLESQWQVPNPQVSTDPLMANRMIAQSPFTELRLSIPPAYVGKTVRIYLVFPPSAQGIISGRGLEAEWRTQGIFLSGKARPGDRVLFFEGTPTGSLLKDFVAYTFVIDARETMGPIRFETVYEIEQR
jgi:hypothetical protein